MTAQIICLPIAAKLWVVVADDRQANFYECGKVLKLKPVALPGNRFLFEESLRYQMTPLPDLALKYDEVANDRFDHSNRSEILTLDRELRRHFIITTAAKLNDLCTQNRHIKLVIAMPPRLLGELREKLSPNTLAHLAAVVPKELTSFDAGDLLTHLEYVLPKITCCC
jgi:protein required for attachment to host cells